MVQWSVPRGQEFIYRIIKSWRQNKLLKPIRSNFKSLLSILRSVVIKLLYQPYPDYKKTNSDGLLLMQKIQI